MVADDEVEGDGVGGAQEEVSPFRDCGVKMEKAVSLFGRSENGKKSLRALTV